MKGGERGEGRGGEGEREGNPMLKMLIGEFHNQTLPLIISYATCYHHIHSTIIYEKANIHCTTYRYMQPHLVPHHLLTSKCPPHHPSLSTSYAHPPPPFPLPTPHLLHCQSALHLTEVLRRPSTQVLPQHTEGDVKYIYTSHVQRIVVSYKNMCHHT